MSIFLSLNELLTDAKLETLELLPNISGAKNADFRVSSPQITRVHAKYHNRKVLAPSEVAKT